MCLLLKLWGKILVNEIVFATVGLIQYTITLLNSVTNPM